MMIEHWYINGLFSVEGDLFYENHKRIGYVEDDDKDDVKRKINNHKGVVDRLSELRELNIEYKRINKKLYNENLKLKKEVESMNTTKWDGTCECCGGTNLYNVINDVYECVDCGTRICLGDLEDE